MQWWTNGYTINMQNCTHYAKISPYEHISSETLPQTCFPRVVRGEPNHVLYCSAYYTLGQHSPWMVPCNRGVP